MPYTSYASRVLNAAAAIATRRRAAAHDPESQLSPEDMEGAPAGRGAAPFSLGSRVQHPEYSVGTVIGVEGSGDRLKLTVSFSIYGSKKFLPRYAQLEKL